MTRLTLPVRDTASNLNEQIGYAAQLIGRSKLRQQIFRKVYFGSKQTKTVEEIADALGISKKHVLTTARSLHPVALEKVDKGYKKIPALAPHYRKILNIAAGHTMLPTKSQPTVNVRLASPKKPSPVFITVEEITNFQLTSSNTTLDTRVIKEEQIKKGFQSLVREPGRFTDWGGEKSDLFTTRLRINKQRFPAAIAFKGRGTKGQLTPRKMGKNGDQIQRLFEEPAQIFLIVYHSQIASSVITQMEAFAKNLRTETPAKQIYYGVIDGGDLGRIVSSYPQEFND